MVLSGICLAAGVGIYVALIVVIVSRRRDAETHPTILSLRPWLILALAGWLGSGGLLAGGAVAAGMAEDALVDADLQRLGVDLYIGAVLIPVAFVFARQVLPLYLRVDMMPPQGLLLMAMAYAVTVVAFVTADLMGHAPALAVARLLQAVLILWVFSRLRIHRRRDPRGRIRPERDGAARFGKFAPAIYLSFGFLLLAA